MKKFVLILVLLLLTALLLCEPYQGPYEVSRVIDRDTIGVMIDGNETIIRLIGLDTPESVSWSKENTEEGKIASDFTYNLLKGKKVYLEYDQKKEDKYGRVLAYIYLENRQCVNTLLLKRGYAVRMSDGSNKRYDKRFDRAEKWAKLLNFGFWNQGVFCP